MGDDTLSVGGFLWSVSDWNPKLVTLGGAFLSFMLINPLVLIIPIPTVLVCSW